MKVFVTGASGLVGTFVVKRLLELGHEPVILLRNVSAGKSAFPLCHAEEGDILDPLCLEKAMQNCEMTIHCAGKVSFDPRKEKEIYAVNVEGTANVVNACLKAGIRKLIHVSSVASLGRPTTTFLLNEKTVWEPSSFNSFYAKSKYLSELEVFRGGEEGLDYSVVNPSVILGPGDLHKSSTRLFSFVRKMPWIYPEGLINVVDVRDVAYTICALLEINYQKRLVVNAQQLTYKEFYGYIRQAYGISSSFYQIPFWLIRTVAVFDAVVTRIKGGEPLVTSETAKNVRKKFSYHSLYFESLLSIPLRQAQESINWTVNTLQSERN